MHPYRLGVAVKVLGGGGLPSHAPAAGGAVPAWAAPSDLPQAVVDHLDAHDLRMYRLSSSTVAT